MTLRLDEMSLHTRISLVLTALAAALVLALGSLWLMQTRDSIREEVEAATRVAEQWLNVSARELHAPQAGWSSARLLAHLRAVGRIRANALEVLDRAGARLYLSPQPTYKAGRAAPRWFAAMVETGFATRRVAAGELTLILHPDASRATLDAWDELRAMAGWAAVLLAALFFTVRHALNRALRPLGQVMAALDRTGRGCFDTRLPVFREPELGRLAHAFNGMADRLVEAVNDNVRLGSERELNERLQARIEADRRCIARELHDELAQGITAVRALAGAIVQRTASQQALQAPAHSIIEVTSQMQDGVRTILQRLRPQPPRHGTGADDALGRYLAAWQRHYPDIHLRMQLAGGNGAVSDAVIEAIVRIAQEGLTNVVRHAAATRVDVSLRRLDADDGGWLELVLADNGRGLGAPTSSAGCGLGLAGMRERAVALAGELRFDTAAGGGTRLCVRLPVTNIHPVEETT